MRDQMIEKVCDVCECGVDDKGIFIREKKSPQAHHFCTLCKCEIVFHKSDKMHEGCLKSDKEEHNRWKGGDSETHKRWVRKNKERYAHLKSRELPRKYNAEGSHTFEQWKSLLNSLENKCACCKEKKKLSKDHIKPLSKGGTDYIHNIQPLCKSCNSRKNAKEINYLKSFFDSPELLKSEALK